MILACRDEARGSAAADSVNQSVAAFIANRNGAAAAAAVTEEAAHPRDGETLATFMKLDLGSFDSIRAFASSFLALPNTPLHILINNACGASDAYQTTADGHELIYGVGQLGHFLLTSLLMDKLKASAPSRIVILTSTATTISSSKGVVAMPVTDASKWSKMFVYAETKLANALFAMELARRSDATQAGVKILAVHPGVIETPLGHTLMPGFFFKLVALTKKTMEQGAATTCFAAAHPGVDNMRNGQYLADCTPSKTSKLAYSEKLAKKVWDKCKAICGEAPFPDTEEEQEQQEHGEEEKKPVEEEKKKPVEEEKKKHVDKEKKHQQPGEEEEEEVKVTEDGDAPLPSPKRKKKKKSRKEESPVEDEMVTED